MNFFRNLKQSVLDGIQVYTISGVLIVLFIQLISHIPTYAWAFEKLWIALTPFIFGIVFAFLMLPLRNLFETKLLAKVKLSSRGKRRISVTSCVILAILLLSLFFWILIPQLLSSVTSFGESFGGYIQHVQDYLKMLEQSEWAPFAKYLSDLVNRFGSYVTQWLTGSQGGLAQIVNFTFSIGKGIVNVIVGFIISIFILADSEMFTKQLKELNFSLLPEQAAESLVYILRLTRDMFNRFVFGKALDSVIIGVLAYIVLRIMNMPYHVLIAVIIGLTNMIPFFGPFIGAVPCFVILIMISPVKALELGVFILVLQQVDGNLIGPYILGDSMGLPTLWIMFAILVGGSLFGIIGMFVSVPLFSVAYILMGDWVHSRLRRRRIVIDGDNIRS